MNVNDNGIQNNNQNIGVVPNNQNVGVMPNNQNVGVMPNNQNMNNSVQDAGLVSLMDASVTGATNTIDVQTGMQATSNVDNGNAVAEDRVNVAPSYVNDEKVQDNIANTKKNTVTINKELKTVIIIAIILFIFIMFLPTISDFIGRFTYQ